MGELTYSTPCSGEHDLPFSPEAVALAPQSVNLGVTVTWTPVCSGHLDGWWDGSDDFMVIPYVVLPGKTVEIEGLLGYYQSWLDNHNANKPQPIPGADGLPDSTTVTNR